MFPLCDYLNLIFRFIHTIFKLNLSVRIRKNSHLMPLAIPVSIANSSHTSCVKMLLTKATRACHRRRTISEKSSYMNNFAFNITNLVTQDHLSVPSVCTVSATTLIKPKKLRRRLLIVSSSNNLVATLDKRNNMISITLTRSKPSNSVVLQTPYSF